MSLKQKGGKLQCWTRRNKQQQNYVVCTGTKTKKKTKKKTTKTKGRRSIRKATSTKPQHSARMENNAKERKIKNVLRIQDDFHELGISRGDWMVDPCYVMNNIKKKLKIKKWSKSHLKKLDKTIPEIKVLKKGYLKYGNYLIAYHKEIGSGTYGTVYSGSMVDRITGKKKNIVIKQVNTTDILEFFSESILQLELFCGMRGLFGFGARIPKMEFVSKYRSRSTGKMKYLVGMEPLEGDCWKFFGNKKIKDIHKIKAIKSVANILKTMQKKFKFMHRDMHLGNIMYKNIGSSSAPNYRMYIIDFGMSTATFNGYKLNQIVNMYDEPYRFNPTHDLRLMMLSMFRSTAYMKDVFKKYLRYIITYSLYSVLRYGDMERKPFFWNGYYQLIKYEDGIFAPDAIIQLCDYVLENGEKKLQNNRKLSVTKNRNLIKMITRNKNELYYIKLKESKGKIKRKSSKKLFCNKDCIFNKDITKVLGAENSKEMEVFYNVVND